MTDTRRDVAERLEARFWAQVDKSGECWEWTGSRHVQGYGHFYHGGKRHRAHRLSWEMANGEEPGKRHVLHRCDNPPCVRPDHLFVGTNMDNIRDRDRKGRTATGARGSAAKLTREQVVAVREARVNEDATPDELAERFGVGRETIRRILRGKAYKDAGGPIVSIAHPISRRVRTKLNRALVAEIRRRYAEGDAKQAELADEFGVAHQTIHKIVNRETWRDV